MQAGELVEGGGGEEDFAAVVGSCALGAGHHDDGVAAVVFVEAAGRGIDAAVAAGGEHGVWVVIVESLVESQEMDVPGGRLKSAYHCGWRREVK